MTGAKNPLVLLVSGGHTMLLAFLNKKWRVFGETLDITLGQLLDQFGRSIGFASPCGKKIEELAEKNINSKMAKRQNQKTNRPTKRTGRKLSPQKEAERSVAKLMRDRGLLGSVSETFE